MIDFSLTTIPPGILEALAEALSSEEVETLLLFQKPASWNQIENGRTTTSFLYHPKTCEIENYLDANGVANTGNEGKVRFRLRDYLCSGPDVFDNPINVVATPIASRPVFLTVKHSLVMEPGSARGRDVEIEIFAWDANGAAASDVTLNWRCRVPYDYTNI